MVNRRDDIPNDDGPPRGHRRQVLTSLEDLESIEGAFSEEEAADETDPKDPERVIGGYKSQITMLQHQLDAAKHFLLREFKVDIGDIDNDSQLVVGSASEENVNAFKASVQTARSEANRWQSNAETLQDNLESVFGNDVTIDIFGHITWNGFMARVAETSLQGQNARQEMEATFERIRQEGSRRPGIRESGAQGWSQGTNRAFEQAGSSRAPRVKAEPVSDVVERGGFHPFGIGRKARPTSEPVIRPAFPTDDNGGIHPFGLGRKSRS